MFETIEREKYPILMLISIPKRKNKALRRYEVLLYPEAAVKAGLFLPLVNGILECDGQADYCKTIRSMLIPLTNRDS